MSYVSDLTENSDTTSAEPLFKYFENWNRYVKRRTIDL